jgi:hypothetical protein
MNKRLFPLFVVILLLLSGCALAPLRGSGRVVSESRTVSEFEQVEVCCGMQLVLTQGDAVQLTLEADDNILPEIETLVRGGTLTVRFRTNPGWLNLRLSRPIMVHLQMPTIHGVTISGGSGLETERLETDRLALEFSGGSQGRIGALQAANVDLLTSGGGQTTIDTVEVDTLNLEVSGGGRVAIDGGTVTNQRVALSGGSHYDGAAVEGESATLDVSGGSEAKVWVTETLAVQASGGSHVDYTGNPTIDQELSGGSELRAVAR